MPARPRPPSGAPRRLRLLGVAVVLVLLAGVVSAAFHPDAVRRSELVRAAPVDPTRPTVATTGSPTTAAPTTTVPAATSTTVTSAPSTTVAPTSTTAAPTSTTAADPARAARAERAGAWSLEPYRGLGAWVDVYDWTQEFTRDGSPRVGPAAVDDMAAAGVQTLFIQTSHQRSSADLIEPSRLASIIDRARANGIWVVAWYLPTFEDLDVDLRRLAAGADAGVDGLAVDIEARHVADHAERNRRLVELSRRLRAAAGDLAIGAITPSAVHLQVVNPAFWPEFPWVEIAATYDVVAPMAYFSIRRGEYRSAERYIGENIDRIRASTGDAQIPIHPIGGIADGATTGDLEGMVRAATDRGATGGSLYDWATSHPAQWSALQPFRSG